MCFDETSTKSGTSLSISHTFDIVFAFFPAEISATTKIVWWQLFHHLSLDYLVLVNESKFGCHAK